MKTSGVLLHISSLPTEYGIGDFGRSAYNFADFLVNNGQSYWQILPLYYPGYGNSPYNPISSFALNPLFISNEMIYEQGLITSSDLNDSRIHETNQIDYEQVINIKNKLLKIAFKHYTDKNSLLDFINLNEDWIKPFIAFRCLSIDNHSSQWYTWKGQHKYYSYSLFEEQYREHPDRVLFEAFCQLICYNQWSALKKHCSNIGLNIIGDIPLYVAYESADVWANHELFEVDHDGIKIKVAGVPPDAFSNTGQLWGNPIYKWDEMRKNGFKWFVDRISHALKQVDILRLDHFIGYYNYWEIPANETTAINGKWVSGARDDLLAILTSNFGSNRFMAEDLGILTEEIVAFRNRYSLPGMIVLQFCFGNDFNDPRNYPDNYIIYTGTHDNPTSCGWFESLKKDSESTFSKIQNYLIETNRIQYVDQLDSVSFCQHFIDIAYESPCRISIIPFQDILALNNSARMNVPGTALGNWTWRLTDDLYLCGEHEHWIKSIKHHQRFHTKEFQI